MRHPWALNAGLKDYWDKLLTQRKIISRKTLPSYDFPINLTHNNNNADGVDNQWDPMWIHLLGINPEENHRKTLFSNKSNVTFPVFPERNQNGCGTVSVNFELSVDLIWKTKCQPTGVRLEHLSQSSLAAKISHEVDWINFHDQTAFIIRR